MSTIAPDQIVDLIAAIKANHPGIELHLCDSDARDLRARLIAGDLELTIYALPGEDADERIHSLPLFREQMVIAVHARHPLAGQAAVRVKDIDGENYIHRNNCEFAGYADNILAAQGVTCHPAYWSDRDDWTLAMVAAGLGFGFMPANSAHRDGVAALPIVEPQFWREVKLASVRGRRHSPAVGALVREAMHKKWFGSPALERRRGVGPRHFIARSQLPTLQIGRLDVDRRPAADVVVVGVEPRPRLLAPGVAQTDQEVPVGVELARHAEVEHQGIAADGVDVHALEVGLLAHAPGRSAGSRNRSPASRASARS